MGEERSLFDRLDDIAATQADILDEVVGIKSQTSSTDNRISELEAEINRLKNNPQQKPQPVNKPQQISTSNELTPFQLFLKRARKSWRWFGSRSEFKRQKNLAIISLIILLVVGLITTIVSSICFKMYSTFTFFENVWMVFAIISLVYAIRAQYKYEVHALASNSPEKYRRDKLDMMLPVKQKAVFVVFRWLAIISVVCNVICIWTLGKDTKAFATIMEVLMLGAIIFALLMNSNLFAQYSIIYIDGHNLETNEKVVLVLLPGAKELMLESEAKEKMPLLFK